MNITVDVAGQMGAWKEENQPMCDERRASNQAAYRLQRQQAFCLGYRDN